MDTTDQLGRELSLPDRPERIVSLVPSQTELLHYLGLDDIVVGITNFCVHPPEWYHNKQRVGGTKKPSVDRIRLLEPDLIIANKEENSKQVIQTLEKEFNVWVSDVDSLATACEMITRIARITDQVERGNALLLEIDRSADQLRATAKASIPALYLIWKNPYMAAGSGTYINSIMGLAGLNNVLQTDRYPELDIDRFTDLNPEVVLYSSEPFPFKEKDMTELRNKLPLAHHILVDGEAFSWYGSRIPSALNYIQELVQNIPDKNLGTP